MGIFFGTNLKSESTSNTGVHDFVVFIRDKGNHADVVQELVKLAL